MVGEPLHSVERREMVVETDWEDFPPESEGAPGPPGVPDHKHFQIKFIFLCEIKPQKIIYIFKSSQLRLFFILENLDHYTVMLVLRPLGLADYLLILIL